MKTLEFVKRLLFQKYNDPSPSPPPDTFLDWKSIRIQELKEEVDDLLYENAYLKEQVKTLTEK